MPAPGSNQEIKDLQGNVIWKTDVEKEKADHKQIDPYTLEHVNFINHIRANQPLNQAVENGYFLPDCHHGPRIGIYRKRSNLRRSIQFIG